MRLLVMRGMWFSWRVVWKNYLKKCPSIFIKYIQKERNWFGERSCAHSLGADWNTSLPCEGLLGRTEGQGAQMIPNAHAQSSRTGKSTCTLQALTDKSQLVLSVHSTISTVKSTYRQFMPEKQRPLRLLASNLLHLFLPTSQIHCLA